VIRAPIMPPVHDSALDNVRPRRVSSNTRASPGVAAGRSCQSARTDATGFLAELEAQPSCHHGRDIRGGDFAQAPLFDAGAAGEEDPAHLVVRCQEAVHAVMAADRTVYTKKVVNRLVKEDKVIKASEHWEDDKALPLPAQMFRFGAEMVAEKGAPFSYSLLSLWPINKQNAPKTDAEKEGLQFIADNPGQNFYKEEELGGVKYYTAIYPDPAVAPACVDCHNDHKDTPKSDFKIGDVMGGVVIRIPLS